MNAGRVACILVAVFQLAGCTTINSIPYTASTAGLETLRVGDHVVAAWSTDGERHERRLVVTSATRERICGRVECVRPEDVDWIQREEFSARNTALAVAGMALMIGLAAASFHMSFGNLGYLGKR